MSSQVEKTSPRPAILTLPLEIRLQIFGYLLTLTTLPIYRDSLPSSRPLIHPAILQVCRQTNTEATPLLYLQNTFIVLQPALQRPALEPLKRTDLEASCPSEPAYGIHLRRHMKPVPLSVAQKHGAWRFLLQWRMDRATGGASVDGEASNAMRKILSGADAVTVQMLLADALFVSPKPEALRMLETVRGVAEVEMKAVAPKIEAYATWLRGAMTSPVGSEVKAFVMREEGSLGRR